MLETFKYLGPLLTMEKYERPDGARENKKAKETAKKAEPEQGTVQLLRAMGQLLLKVDAEQQALKRQDSWICFMQTEPQALLPSLIQKANAWKQQQKMKTEPTQEINPVPLRSHLTLHLAESFLFRVQRLAQSSDTDQLKVVAHKHGMLNRDNAFPFQRWSPRLQGLRTTTQEPIPLPRMVKYGEQLLDLMKDPSMTIKFHSMRPQAEAPVIPWMWQISMPANFRCCSRPF